MGARAIIIDCEILPAYIYTSNNLIAIIIPQSLRCKCAILVSSSLA